MESTASTEGFNTPTHTSIPDTNDPGCDLNLDLELPTYSSLRTPVTSFIALKGGELGLHPQEKERNPNIYHDGWGGHWICTENKGMWLGFRNAVSGTYIGHNNDKRRNWRFIAKARHQDSWECFCAREHPSGGHVLLVKHWDEFLPMKIGGVDNKELVVDSEEKDGTVWEFIRVDSEI
ncbi:hypothetical protein MW887_001079 [Aspergillus wentii]|nr:hypothetical protein MW887_001079 [Aspergillus wentii]